VTRQRRRTGRSGLLCLGLTLTIAGCLGSTALPNPSIRPPDVAATPAVAAFAIAATVWVDGFVITIHSATASLDAKGGPVSIPIAIENPGTEPATLDAPIRLTASGGAVFEVSRGTQLPEVAAGGFAELTIEFEVVGRAAISDGVLRIGRTEDHQAVIPFGPGLARLVTLEPQALELTGTATAGGLRVALRRGGVRWDLPDWHTELPVGTEALTLTYDTTYVGDFAGGLAFTADSVGLRLPDGTIVAPRPDGHSQSIQVVGPKQTARGLESRFEIPTGLTGRFALIIRDGSTRKAIPFTIGP
jgi:hypothetical protein